MAGDEAAKRRFPDFSEVIAMAEPATRAWTRPHDWAEVVLGVVAALSFLWVDTDNTTMWTMIVLGALLVISPWVMDYTAMTGASLTSWIAGGLTLLAGAAALPLANAAHGRM